MYVVVGWLVLHRGTPPLPSSLSLTAHSVPRVVEVPNRGSLLLGLFCGLDLHGSRFELLFVLLLTGVCKLTSLDPDTDKFPGGFFFSRGRCGFGSGCALYF